MITRRVNVVFEHGDFIRSVGRSNGVVEIGFCENIDGKESFVFRGNYNDGGSVSITIPISGVKLRRRIPTKAGFKVDREEYRWIVIIDDFGGEYNISIDDQNIVYYLIRELDHFEVPEIMEDI